MMRCYNVQHHHFNLVKYIVGGSMNRLSKQIPEGMQDTLPGECRQKRKVEGALRALFELSLIHI